MTTINGTTTFDATKELLFVNENGVPLLRFSRHGCELTGRHKNVLLSTLSANYTFGPTSKLVIVGEGNYEKATVSPVPITGGAAGGGEIRTDWFAHASSEQTVVSMTTFPAASTIEKSAILHGARSATEWNYAKVEHPADGSVKVRLYDRNQTLLTGGTLPVLYQVDILGAASNDEQPGGNKLTTTTNHMPSRAKHF